MSQQIPRRISPADGNEDRGAALHFAQCRVGGPRRAISSGDAVATDRLRFQQSLVDIVERQCGVFGENLREALRIRFGGGDPFPIPVLQIGEKQRNGRNAKQRPKRRQRRSRRSGKLLIRSSHLATVARQVSLENRASGLIFRS